MTPSTRKKGIVTSLGVLTAVATLLSGGVTTAYANDALANPNSAMGYPSFKGAADPIPGTGVAFDPSTSYLKQVFDADVANGAGTDTAHDFWIDKMLTRTGTAQTVPAPTMLATTAMRAQTRTNTCSHVAVPHSCTRIRRKHLVS